MSLVTGKVLGDVTNKEVPSGTINGSNVTFTLSFSPVSSDSLNLFLDRGMLELTTHYSISGVTITMVTAPAVGQSLYASYQYKS
jgi:hypothetical protein